MARAKLLRRASLCLTRQNGFVTLCDHTQLRQNGTAVYDNFCAVDVDQDGSIVLAGNGGEDSSTYDVIVIKLDGDGNLMWQFQVGVVIQHSPVALTAPRYISTGSS